MLLKKIKDLQATLTGMQKAQIVAEHFTINIFEWGWEVNGGYVVVEGKDGYLAMNTFLKEGRICYAGPDDQGLIGGNVEFDDNPDNILYNQSMPCPKAGENFSVDCGVVYGEVTFNVVTMEDLEDAYLESLKPKPVVEVKAPERDIHASVYTLWDTDEEGTKYLFAQNHSGTLVACCSIAEGWQLNPWKKIFFIYGSIDLACGVLSHYTGKSFAKGYVDDGYVYGWGPNNFYRLPDNERLDKIEGLPYYPEIWEEECKAGTKTFTPYVTWARIKPGSWNREVFITCM